MFIFEQSTGRSLNNGLVLGTGHAGNGAGLNNPAQQAGHNIGPLPQGNYTIMPEASNPQLGIVAMALVPDKDNEMFGRAGFYIHAPVLSEGCIVQELTTRCVIAELVRKGINRLQVINGL